jgi:hypothetical protein
MCTLRTRAKPWLRSIIHWSGFRERFR